MNSKTNSNHRSPKVSIGMPVFNSEKFIREALDSLLAQTFSDFELIISDNASNDGTEGICREYAARDPRIRYVRQSDNKGAIANFQFVLNEAAGEFFMWAAADDRRDPEFLRVALQVFEAHGNCGLVFCDYRILNFETGDSSIVHVGMFNSAKPGKRYLMRLLTPCSSLIYGLHRLSILRQIPLDVYDFFDMHLTHWYAINSMVKIIPLPLYTAGVKGPFSPKGTRIPYSSTGKRIDASRFFREEKKMLFEKVPFFTAVTLYILLKYFYFKNVNNLNKIIRTHFGRIPISSI